MIITPERINKLRWENAELTMEEFSYGIHYCFSEWDYLLITPDTPEFDCCTCFTSEQKEEFNARFIAQQNNKTE
jgi:hypothetical protein